MGWNVEENPHQQTDPHHRCSLPQQRHVEKEHHNGYCRKTSACALSHPWEICPRDNYIIIRVLGTTETDLRNSFSGQHTRDISWSTEWRNKSAFLSLCSPYANHVCTLITPAIICSPTLLPKQHNLPSVYDNGEVKFHTLF